MKNWKMKSNFTKWLVNLDNPIKSGVKSVPFEVIGDHSPLLLILSKWS